MVFFSSAAYLHASKIAKLAAVIIPTDRLKALIEVMRAVEINPNNNFVVPNTKSSWAM